MKLKVFSVFDSKVGAFAQPFFMRSVGEALRGWIDIVNDPKTTFFAHPEDFTLFELAEYNPDSGTFENHLTPISHGVGIEFHRSNPQTSAAAQEGFVR